MAVPFDNLLKLEVRGGTYFLHAQGKDRADFHDQIGATYGKNTMSKCQVYLWCSLINAGRTSLDDETRLGRPSIQERKIASVDDLIKQDRRLNVPRIAEKFEMSKNTAHRMISEELGKVSA